MHRGNGCEQGRAGHGRSMSALRRFCGNIQRLGLRHNGLRSAVKASFVSCRIAGGIATTTPPGCAKAQTRVHIGHGYMGHIYIQTYHGVVP